MFKLIGSQEVKKDFYIHVHSSIVHNSKKWKQLTYPLIDEWINKIQWNAVKPSKETKILDTGFSITDT